MAPSNPLPPLAHPCLDAAILAASQAGEIISNYFRNGCTIRDKGVGDLVTTADTEAEKRIIQTIHSAFPNHHVLAEESAIHIDDCEHLWVVDPLDGTNNFAHGIPHFAVSIGYVRHGVAELGVIFQPMTQDWYLTVRGQGAFFNGQQTHVNQESKLNQTLVAIGFYYDRGALMEATLDAVRDFFHKNIHGVRRFGTASLDLGMVGRGLFGTFFEYQLQPWDHAAGALFVEESGGRVTDCDEKPLAYSGKTSLLATNGLLHAPSLAIAREHWRRLEA